MPCLLGKIVWPMLQEANYFFILRLVSMTSTGELLRRLWNRGCIPYLYMPSRRTWMCNHNRYGCSCDTFACLTQCFVCVWVLCRSMPERSLHCATTTYLPWKTTIALWLSRFWRNLSATSWGIWARSISREYGRAWSSILTVSSGKLSSSWALYCLYCICHNWAM